MTLTLTRFDSVAVARRREIQPFNATSSRRKLGVPSWNFDRYVNKISIDSRCKYKDGLRSLVTVLDEKGRFGGTWVISNSVNQALSLDLSIVRILFLPFSLALLTTPLHKHLKHSMYRSLISHRASPTLRKHENNSRPCSWYHAVMGGHTSASHDKSRTERESEKLFLREPPAR